MSFIFDKALELRDIADGAETADVAEAGLALDVINAGNFKCVVHVSALDTANADETYAVIVETDSVAAFSDTPVEVGRVAVTGTGVYEVLLSGEGIAKLDPDAAAIRVSLDVAGTTPSITYGAFADAIR